MISSFLKSLVADARGLTIRSILTVFFAALLAVSMTCSPFLLSISMWGFVAMAWWDSAVSVDPGGLRRPSTWWKALVRSFRRFFRHRALLPVTLLFFVPALSYFWSDDHAYWLERMRIRVPFFVLPWAFANLPSLTKRQFRLALYLLVWSLAVICAGVLINFALHFDAIIADLGMGRPMPVPRSHIRFSLVLATGIFTGAWLWFDGFYWKWRRERRLLALVTVFLFVCIHVISVRSGIAGLYAVLLFSAGRFIWKTRRWGLGLAALSAILIVPLIAIQAIPSFKMRVEYMKWDWLQYRQNIGSQYSDSERWISLEAGLDLWRAHPVLGVGAGDLPEEIRRTVTTRYPEYREAPKLPHNQFLYILAGTGLLGLLASMIAFMAPVARAQSRRFYLFAAFQILAFTSFLVEYTIETAMGAAFYLFYTLWFFKMAEQES
ncbi:MAG: O-antigen ligase family protein [Saprospiraceae bacterium]|nr:O-antigen ligase family protein [Saprospiraceae bacterium]